jgi:hypothetical protein
VRLDAREHELLAQLDDAVLMEAPRTSRNLRADIADAREACARNTPMLEEPVSFEEGQVAA